MFARIGTWCHDRRRLVLVAWILVLVVLNGIANGAVKSDYKQDFSLPGADSTKGFDILKAQFGGKAPGVGGTIVFKADQGVNDPAVKAAMTTFLTNVVAIKGVAGVESPYDPGGQRFVSSNGDSAGKIAYANVNFPRDVDFGTIPDIKKQILAAEPKIDGVQIELGGQILAAFEQPTTEAIGLGFAIVILIIAFGSVLAMGLPVAVALFGIGIGGAGVIFFSHILSVPEFAPFLGVMIGLGVGIDYALLIITRYREQLHLDHTVRESVAIALDTAGRSVLFAGGTVVISLLGMLLMGVSFVQGLAVSASTTVLITVLASLTLLPALLGFAGANVERTRWRGLVAAGLVAVGLVGYGLQFKPLMVGTPLALLVLLLGFFVPKLKEEVRHRAPRPRRETLAYRWSRGIQHRPWTAFVAAGGALLILSVPILGLRLGFSDESNFAKSTTTRKAYDLLVAGFGKGFNGPLLLVTELKPGTTLAQLATLKTAVSADPNVAFVSDPIPNSPLAPTAALWNVAPKTGPQDAETASLVHRLRSGVLPGVEQTIGSDVHLTGFTAGNVDASALMGKRLPYFFLAVLGLSFLFLMTVFRSILVPLKAVVMNMLSIGASYGVIVALFEWGWLGKLTGLSPGPIEPWAPMMLFAIVFGLSMDYEVFLLSRIREEWLHSGDSHTSVSDGLAATAKVITAAAAIMVVVFGSFLLEDNRTFKLMGTGLSVAVLLDATVVRMLLVPATMELLGDRNWWLPKWLDNILPNIAVEGTEGAAAFEHEHEEALREERERELEPSAGD
ncbi:MAG: putative drug exporter of the superfamily [Actinomycetota bacterium]|jgi:RND superfamily putative drug exporter